MSFLWAATRWRQMNACLHVNVMQPQQWVLNIYRSFQTEVLIEEVKEQRESQSVFLSEPPQPVSWIHPSHECPQRSSCLPNHVMLHHATKYTSSDSTEFFFVRILTQAHHHHHHPNPPPPHLFSFLSVMDDLDWQACCYRNQTISIVW